MIRGWGVGITSCSIICVSVNTTVCTRYCLGGICVVGVISLNARGGQVENGVLIQTGFVIITGNVTVV